MLGACLLGLLLSAPQNREHPGLVSLGDGRWGTPAQAAEAGMIQDHEQWFLKRLEKDLKKWDKEDAKKGLDWKEAYRAESKYYRIQTNVPRFRIELEIKPFLDELFETYKKVFVDDFGLKGKAVNNKDIRIYDGFNAYSVNEADKGQPRPRTNPGFCENGSVLVVYYDETDPGVFYRTVFHEGAHQFFQSLLPGADPPIWLTEALASYFEGCTYSRATNKITPGFVAHERIAVAQSVLRHDKSATAEQLFLDVPKERFLGQEYALAWSFIYYLIHRPGEKSHDHFVSFVQEMNGSGAKPAAEVFKKATGENLADLIPGWRDYVLGLKIPPTISWVVLDAAKASAAEDVRKGDLLWSLDGVEVYGVTQFDELWLKRPKDRPFDVVVVRCEPDMTSAQSTRRFVRVTVFPESELVLRAGNEMPRHDALLD